MGLPPGCSRLHFREEETGTEWGTWQSFMVSYLSSPPLAGAGDNVLASNALQRDQRVRSVL